MPSLDDLRAEVSALVKNESDDFEFADVYRDIEAAAKTTNDNEIVKLNDILSAFRGKVPNRVTLNRIRANAKDLAEALALDTLQKRIDAIGARNAQIKLLTDELDKQIAKANQDAALLTQIKTAVTKATSTVNEVKHLVDTLSSTDVTTKNKIKAFIDAVSHITSIFDPDE